MAKSPWGVLKGDSEDTANKAAAFRGAVKEALTYASANGIESIPLGVFVRACKAYLEDKGMETGYNQSHKYVTLALEKVDTVTFEKQGEGPAARYTIRLPPAQKGN